MGPKITSQKKEQLPEVTPEEEEVINELLEEYH